MRTDSLTYYELATRIPFDLATRMPGRTYETAKSVHDRKDEITVRVGGVELGQLPLFLGREHGFQLVFTDGRHRLLNGKGEEVYFLLDGEALAMNGWSRSPYFFQSDYRAGLFAYFRGLEVPDDVKPVFKTALWRGLVRRELSPLARACTWQDYAEAQSLFRRMSVSSIGLQALEDAPGLHALRDTPYVWNDMDLPDPSKQWPLNISYYSLEFYLVRDSEPDAGDADASD